MCVDLKFLSLSTYVYYTMSLNVTESFYLYPLRILIINFSPQLCSKLVRVLEDFQFLYELRYVHRL